MNNRICIPGLGVLSSIEIGISRSQSSALSQYGSQCPRKLYLQRANLILAGGVVELSEFLFRGFSDLHLLATGKGYGERSSPYDGMRNGIILGERAGTLVLESENHACLR